MNFIDLEMTNDNSHLVNLCNVKRLELHSSPTQSNFRVYCLLIVKLKDLSHVIIEGTNCEQGYIGGAICAERAALTKLRMMDHPSIIKIVVTTDSANAISPGVLCREFLMSSAEPSVPVIMGNSDSSKISECTLGYLYPFPYVHRYITRTNLLEAAESFTRKLIDTQKILSENLDIRRLYQAASECNKNDKNDRLHPVRFSSAVMFGDGSVECAWQLKGLEYGCTLDPVSQLIREMERRRIYVSDAEVDGQMTAKYLLMVDQFGVCHAPFAQARALLTEHGYDLVKILVHDSDGVLHVIDARSLVPHIDEATILSHADFGDENL